MSRQSLRKTLKATIFLLEVKDNFRHWVSYSSSHSSALWTCSHSIYNCFCLRCILYNYTLYAVQLCHNPCNWLMSQYMRPSDQHHGKYFNYILKYLRYEMGAHKHWRRLWQKAIKRWKLSLATPTTSLHWDHTCLNKIRDTRRYAWDDFIDFTVFVLE